MANPPGTRIDIVVCQKHGLRYNRATDKGCAVCRRDGEEAEPPPAPAPAAPPRPLPSASTPPPRPATARATDSQPVAAASATRVEIATCDKHGLRYNRAVEKGCVRCRAESGSVAGGGGGTRAGAAPSRAAADRSASLQIQLLIAALLIGGTGGLFYGAHQAVIESFSGGLLAGAAQSGAEAAAAPRDASYDAPDPAEWPPPRPTATPPVPPGMRGRGPAEQQKQIEDLFRQMKEEEAKENAASERQDAPQ